MVGPGNVRFAPLRVILHGILVDDATLASNHVVDDGGKLCMGGNNTS